MEGKGIFNHDIPLTQEEVNNLIKKDCILPDNICTKIGQVKVDLKDVSKVFVTGCTGMLGPYILKELTNMSQIKQVVCLIRPRKQICAKDRLTSILQDRELLDQVDLSKVDFVDGHIGKKQLGMENCVWEELCESVDAIIHCAASVKHIQEYRKSDTHSDVRGSNVGGLLNILELVCTGSKLKHVFSASSLIAVTTLDENGCVSESWPEPNDFDDVTKLAYPISKFVGDVLMKTAVLERDIPGKVFRFPIIMGDSKSGRGVIEHNHLMMKYLFMLKYGIMPSVPFPYPLLPVDICASVSVKLFFVPSTPNDIFNVSNKTPDVEQEFVRVAEKLGYEVNIVEYTEFCEKVRQSTSENSPYFIFRLLYQRDEDTLAFFNKTAIGKKFIRDGGSKEDFFVSKKIGKILPEFYKNCASSMDLIYRDLLFAQKQGWFKKFNV